METALIVSSTDAGIKALFGLLKDLHLSDVQFAMNSGEARRRLAGQSYDLAVINTPLRDEFGNDLAWPHSGNHAGRRGIAGQGGACGADRREGGSHPVYLFWKSRSVAACFNIRCG